MELNIEAVLIEALARKVAEAITPILTEQVVEAVGRLDGPPLLSVEEAGRYLARSKRAVEAMIFDGKLPVVRDGRSVRLSRKALDAWIEDHTEQSY